MAVVWTGEVCLQEMGKAGCEEDGSSEGWKVLACFTDKEMEVQRRKASPKSQGEGEGEGWDCWAPAHSLRHPFP